MTVKNTLGVVVVVFLIFYAITYPDHAASVFQSTWDGVTTMAHGIGSFFNKLAS